ncbi:hypothetical protein KY285_027048 [Solanum tuberosum]|nr:hypothetical protein KY285_027048 [Solanum tuberosum]
MALYFKNCSLQRLSASLLFFFLLQSSDLLHGHNSRQRPSASLFFFLLQSSDLLHDLSSPLLHDLSSWIYGA